MQQKNEMKIQKIKDKKPLNYLFNVEMKVINKKQSR